MTAATPALPLTVQLSGQLYTATYASSDGIVTVDSAHGCASAPHLEASAYAAAISLFFTILRAARDARLPAPLP